MHQVSIVKLTPWIFEGDPSRTSITYLKPRGKASGSVNFPIPISAAPTTNRKWGLTQERNLMRGEPETFTRMETMTHREDLRFRVGRKTMQSACRDVTLCSAGIAA